MIKEKKVKKCKYPECINKYYSSGYCRKHYNFYIYNGLEPTPQNYLLIHNRKKQIIREAKTKYTPQEKKYIETIHNEMKELIKQINIELKNKNEDKAKTKTLIELFYSKVREYREFKYMKKHQTKL